MAILYSYKVFVMGVWQLWLALVCRQVRQVDVWAVRGAGYAVRVATRDGRVHALCPPMPQRLWPTWPPLKARLQRCGAGRGHWLCNGVALGQFIPKLQ